MARVSPSPEQAPQRSWSYRGFRLVQRHDLSWVVNPEHLEDFGGSFTTPPNSLADVKALIDWRLDQAA